MSIIAQRANGQYTQLIDATQVLGALRRHLNYASNVEMLKDNVEMRTTDIINILIDYGVNDVQTIVKALAKAKSSLINLDYTVEQLLDDNDIIVINEEFVSKLTDYGMSA